MGHLFAIHVLERFTECNTLCISPTTDAKAKVDFVYSNVKPEQLFSSHPGSLRTNPNKLKFKVSGYELQALVIEMRLHIMKYKKSIIIHDYQIKMGLLDSIQCRNHPV